MSFSFGGWGSKDGELGIICVPVLLLSHLIHFLCEMNAAVYACSVTSVGFL